MVTQLFFDGDPLADQDPFFKKSLSIELRRTPIGGAESEVGVFDIVLASVTEGL